MTWYHQTRGGWNKAKTCSYKNSIYDSRFEASYAMELDARLQAGEFKSWDRQKTLPLIVNGYTVCTYKIDFIIHHNDGSTEYVETKGYATPLWRLKWKLFEALYSELPDVILTVVQQKNNFRIPKAKRVA